MTRYWFEDTATVEYTPVDGTGTPITDGTPLDSAETVTLTDTPWAEGFDTDTFYRFEATVARPIEQTYHFNDDELVLKKPESELREALWQLENCPWTVEHPRAKRVTSIDQVRGFWRRPRYADGQRALLHVPQTDSEALAYLTDNEAVSIGFQAEIDFADEEATVDGYQRGLVYDHVASVEHGRCPVDAGCGIHTDSQTNVMHVLTDSIQEGSWVKWDWSGGTAYGKVIETSDTKTLEAAGNTRTPTEDRTAYKMVSWDDESESWDSMVVKLENENDLRAWDDPPSNPPEMPTGEDAKHMDDAHYGTREGREDGVRSQATEEAMTVNAEMTMDPMEEAMVTYTPEEAAVLAEQLGCDGLHKHDHDGETRYMPCGDMERLREVADTDHPDCSDGVCSCGCHIDTENDAESNEASDMDIDLTPPAKVVNAVEAAMDAKAEYSDAIGDCGTGVGEQMGKAIVNDELTPEIIANGGSIASYSPATYLDSHGDEGPATDAPPIDWGRMEWLGMESEDDDPRCGPVQLGLWGYYQDWFAEKKREVEQMMNDRTRVVTVDGRGITDDTIFVTR